MTKDSDQMSLPLDFLANHLVSQENNNLKKITEISGRKLIELSKSPDPLGLLEKMLMESLNSISTPYLRTWKIQTTPQGALILALKASVLPTKDKESGLLPTPIASTAKRSEGAVRQMRRLVEQGVYTKEQAEAMIEGSLTPKRMAKWNMYPTPTSSEHKYRLKGNTQQSKCLESMARRTGGRLSANFTEYLMGFQQDWTKIEPTGSKDSETQSCRKSHSTSDKP